MQGTAAAKRDAVAVSLQTIATRTGLSKSTAQAAVKHLYRRGLLDPEFAATTSHPVRRVIRPWRSGG
jgi:DNA-binding IclR family transcriptional regulator